MTDEENKQIDRWMNASHAMQSGVAIEMSIAEQKHERNPATEPKHLRVGVNNALSDHAGLVKLLIDKGIITNLEYLTTIADFMENEQKRYENCLSEKLQTKVTLG